MSSRSPCSSPCWSSVREGCWASSCPRRSEPVTGALFSRLPTVARAALVGLLLAGLIGFGLVADDYLLDIGVLVGVYTILGLGLSIVIGQAGLLDLGYIAFYAIGAYWTALLSTHLRVSFWILLPTS